ITLPYLQALRNSLPAGTQLDFLTRKEVDPIPRDLLLFNRVFSIGGKRNARKQLLSACLLLPRLLFRRYDVVIDLQNNRISRLVRKILRPAAWSEFDRYSPHAAGERTRRTIAAAGLGSHTMDTGYRFKPAAFREEALLKSCGWDGKSQLVILNPAGAFPTRHWPMAYYVAFARLWLQDFPDTQFIALGIKFIAEKAMYLKTQLGDKLLYMIDNTSPSEGFRIIQRCRFMLSEDSGLMHMSWVSGKPTVVLLGATRSDWVRPQHQHSLVFSSDDLPCGNCMRDTCKYQDVHCLTRYTPEIVFQQTKTFITSLA
ncbi:MAG TPA: glycosyltransferase family 9 protein, partial [Chitinophaga sp.]